MTDEPRFHTSLYRSSSDGVGGIVGRVDGEKEGRGGAGLADMERMIAFPTDLIGWISSIYLSPD